MYIDVILQGWDDNKWEHPVIEEKIRPDRVVMTLSLEATSTDNNRQQPKMNHPQTTHKPPTNDYYRVLECLLDGEKPMVSLMEVCGYKDKRSFRKSVLNEKFDNGLVAMTHSENVNHKKQRYVLTDMGRKIMKEVWNLVTHDF